MPDTSPARPPNLTLALLFIGFTSALLLFNVGGVLMSWTSLDLQESLREGLDEARIQDAGVSIDSAMTAIRGVSYALVPVAVAGMVLAFYALRGHRGSRIPLSIISGMAALLFFTTVAFSFLSVIPAALLTACTVAIWSPDARRWYALKNGQADPARPAVAGPPTPWAGPDREESVTSALPSDADRPGDSSAPQPWGQGPADPSASDAPPSGGASGGQGAPQQPAQGQAPGWPAYPGPEQPAPAAGPPSTQQWQAPPSPGRPGAVWAAAATAGVASLLALGFGVIIALVGISDRESFRRGFEQDPDARRSLAESGLTVDDLLTIFLVAGLVVVVLALLGLLASLAYVLRWPGGLPFLCVMSAIAVISIVTCVGLLNAAAGVAVLILALRKDARDWSARRR